MNPRRRKHKPIDGDTIAFKIALQGANKVRLAGINTPELGTPGGQLAKERLKRLIGKRPITIEPVGRSYDRLVGIVRSGGRNINNAMKRWGY